MLTLLLVPRVVALDADTLPSLCWNSGIWTDEGFYTYNARNAALWGKPEMDEFNNRNLSPVLDAAQRAVFGLFGVGLVQARAISVVCALGALAFFYDALRRVWGTRVGLTGLLFLGGEVTFILYNRLALMETPSVLVSCAALWAVVVGGPVGWVLGGALAASAIAFKTTFLIFLPIPLLVWWWRRIDGDRDPGRPMAWYGLGALAGAGLYLLLWGLPHRHEIVRMNNYYRTRQIQPRSAKQAWELTGRALMGYKRGLLQYLETRTPVLATLALVGLLTVPLKGRGHRTHPASPRAGRRRDLLRVFWLWAVLGLIALAVSRYSPSRYYLVVYPALAGLASVTLWRLVPLWRRARRPGTGSWRVLFVLVAPAFFLFYHLLLPVIYALGAERFGLVCQLLGALGVGGVVWGLRFRSPGAPRPQTLATGVVALFLALSLGQWGYWYLTRGYQTRDTARYLAGVVGPDAVLAGDWAPNLCLGNRVRAVPVLPGLANWQNPVQTLAADFVLVTQTPYPIRYWRKQAPQVVRSENLVEQIRFHEYQVNLYRVPKASDECTVARATPATHKQPTQSDLPTNRESVGPFGHPHYWGRGGAAMTHDKTGATAGSLDTINATSPLGSWLLLSCIAIWGVNAVAFKVGQRTFDPIMLNGLRFLVVAPCITLIVAVLRPQALRLPGGRDILRYVLYSFFSVVLGETLITLALRYTSVANMTLLGPGTAPLFTALWAWALRDQTLTRIGWVGALVAFAGMGVVVASAGNGLRFEAASLVGDGIVLFRSFVHGAYLLLLTRTLRERSVFTVTVYNVGCGALWFLPYVLWKAPTFAWENVPPVAWWALAWTIFPTTVYGFLIWNLGMRQVGAVAATNLFYLLPVFGALAAWLLLNEPLHWGQVLGGAVIVGGIVLLRWDTLVTAGVPATLPRIRPLWRR